MLKVDVGYKGMTGNWLGFYNRPEPSWLEEHWFRPAAKLLAKRRHCHNTLPQSSMDPQIAYLLYTDYCACEIKFKGMQMLRYLAGIM